ncbi:MAG: glycosyltransferase [Anaerolineae bacterium]|nr:glycosyltransferase [Anaerolineae bacterium]
MSSAIEQPVPRVSVITPTYNRATYLQAALASILAQSLAPWEIIIIDDGSTDNTIQIIRDAPGPIRLFQQAHQGVVAARNLGLEKSSGDLIAWLDSDDLWEPDFLATVVPLLAKDGMLDGVYTGFTMIDAGGAKLRTSVRVEPPDQLYEMLTQGCFILTSSFVARKRCYDDVGGFDPQFRIAEDADMFLRLARQFRIVGVPQPLVRYRVHATNTMANADAFREARLRFAHKQCGEDLDSGSNLSNAARVAYGHAFRAIALKYIEGGQQTEGWSFMNRAAALSPPILSELRTFYELACGDQSRGHRGDAKQLDIKRIAVEMLQWLDQLFAKGEADLLALRGVAFGNAYLALGMLSDQAECWRDARSYLFRALGANPRLVTVSGVLRRLLKVTFLTPRFAAVVRSYRRARQAPQMEVNQPPDSVEVYHHGG